ncbi:hypothetical protein [Streptomyces sp. NPDC017202]|uniref:hypothetical protein n=1 Tax=Streptomyces sp. NPDC017202 TaxID=3364981 RepID=UPI0037A8AB67
MAFSTFWASLTALAYAVERLAHSIALPASRRPWPRRAARKLAEELGIRALPRLLFTFLNRSGLSPHWPGVHEAMVPDAAVPDPDEVAWLGWLTEPELRSALLEWRFIPDSNEAFSRYLAFRTARP